MGKATTGLGSTDWFNEEIEKLQLENQKLANQKLKMEIAKGEDSVMGMEMGEFAIGAGQLALGIADFFGKQEYNDAAMDSMKASTKLTQDQYNDFKNYKNTTAARWA